jgi:hypothetical protein
MPALLLDPLVLAPIEEECRDALGDHRFEELRERGSAMSHDELMDFVGEKVT